MSDLLLIDEQDWPRCAVCDMPVMDFLALVGDDGALTLAVWCHDAEDVVRFAPEDVAQFQGGTIKMGLAFAGPRGDNEETRLA